MSIRQACSDDDAEKVEVAWANLQLLAEGVLPNARRGSDCLGCASETGMSVLVRAHYSGGRKHVLQSQQQSEREW